jgi:hypothetical protein
MSTTVQYNIQIPVPALTSQVHRGVKSGSKTIQLGLKWLAISSFISVCQGVTPETGSDKGYKGWFMHLRSGETKDYAGIGIETSGLCFIHTSE